MWIQSPWYEEIISGKKTIEGRVGKEDKFRHLVGKKLVIKNPNKKKENIVKVIDLKHYDSLDEYVDASGWENIAPHRSSSDDTLVAYRSIYDRDGNQVFSDENIALKGGMNAIYIKIESQSC
jgi:ASC-1-like (ASCH) protein